jgi:predicted ATPase
MINSLRLQGFKSFRDAMVRVGPLTVIVGTNASGKSNLRDAFRFLHGISRGYSLADIVGEKFVEGLLQWRGIRGGSREVASFGQSSFSLETRFPLRTGQGSLIPARYRHRITVEVTEGPRPLRVAQESLYRHQKIVYDSHPLGDAPPQEAPEYIMVRLRQTGSQRRRGYTVRFLSDQPVLWQLMLNNKVPKELQEYARVVISNLRSMRFLDLSPEAMKVPSVPGQPLGDRGENLSSALQLICEDESRKRAVTEWIRQLTPLDVTDFEFIPDQTGKILLALVESNGQRTSAYSASDGTLRFLAMIATLMGSDAAQFYFLEEIDNGIHPTRLNLLLQLIEQQAKHGKVQVITTTHSPHLLAMLSPGSQEHALLAYRLEGEGEAHVQRILDIPTAREVLEKQNLGRLHESGWLENVAAFARSEDEDR